MAFGSAGRVAVCGMLLCLAPRCLGETADSQVSPDRLAVEKKAQKDISELMEAISSEREVTKEESLADVAPHIHSSALLATSEHTGPSEAAAAAGSAETGDDYAYTNVDTLSTHLGQISEALQEDIKQAKQNSGKALTDNNAMEDMIDKLFGNAKDVKGLKGLDKQSHSLRGHLVKKHEWLQKVLENVIADFDDLKGDKAPKAQTAEEKVYKPYDGSSAKQERTGLDPVNFAPEPPKPKGFESLQKTSDQGGFATVAMGGTGKTSEPTNNEQPKPKPTTNNEVNEAERNIVENPENGGGRTVTTEGDGGLAKSDGGLQMDVNEHNNIVVKPNEKGNGEVIEERSLED